MIIINILGALIFQFLLWRRLRADYHFERIFGLGFYSLLGLVCGVLLSIQLYPSFWFWASCVGVTVGFLVGRTRQRTDFFESLEALIIGLLCWFSLILISDTVANSSFSSFISFWVTLCMIALFFYLDANYKRYAWYKSGRVGFAGLVTAMFFFIARAISQVNIVDVVFSSLTTLIFVIMLYNRSKQ